MKTYQDMLQEILSSKEMSKYRLARIIGVRWATLHLWIKGVYSPSEENQVKIDYLYKQIINNNP